MSMEWSGCDNLRAVRERLGKSQSELAALLGISVRAVQSYEQGWRRMPLPVQKLAALLCHLAGRERHPEMAPCWEVRRCDPARREDCVVHQLQVCDLCWLFCDYRPPHRLGLPAAPQADCAQCPVTQGWRLAKT